MSCEHKSGFSMHQSLKLMVAHDELPIALTNKGWSVPMCCVDSNVLRWCYWYQHWKENMKQPEVWGIRGYVKIQEQLCPDLDLHGIVSPQRAGGEGAVRNSKWGKWLEVSSTYPYCSIYKEEEMFVFIYSLCGVEYYKLVHNSSRPLDFLLGVFYK